MANKNVSVVIPVYNAEKYIMRCLESLQQQTYTEFECILVDDGSIDGSKLLIKKICKEDPRFRYIYQENSGPSASRNRGVKEADGKYLIFIDADDYVEKNYIEELVYEIGRGEDLVCCGYVDISKYGTVLCNDFEKSDFSREGLVNCILQGTGGVLWGKIFRTSVIKENNIQLDEKLFMCEDMIFVLQYAKYVNRWSVLQKQLYYYNRLNENSISKKINDEYLNNYEIFFKRLIDELRKLEIEKYIIEEWSNKKIADTLTNLIKLSKGKSNLILKLKGNTFWSTYFKRNSKKNIILKLASQENVLLLRIYIFWAKQIRTAGGDIKRYLKRLMK